MNTSKIKIMTLVVMTLGVAAAGEASAQVKPMARPWMDIIHPWESGDEHHDPVASAEAGEHELLSPDTADTIYMLLLAIELEKIGVQE